MRKPLLLFAHGAGAGQSHPWMQSWAQRLSKLGSVAPFDYPYMAGKSMGSRVGCHLALEVSVDGIVCCGWRLLGGFQNIQLSSRVARRPNL
jgi:hypothetical protein